MNNTTIRLVKYGSQTLKMLVLRCNATNILMVYRNRLRYRNAILSAIMVSSIKHLTTVALLVAERVFKLAALSKAYLKM